ncbi:MAG: hypothetical protein K2L24_02935 [Opitutales bacterium]|nr:hypothetical protein [Opitutales bacterium]
MSDLRLNQTSSYSALPKLDPDIKRVMDNVNKDTQRLANEAPEKSPQPILDSLKNGRCKNTLAGRFRALAAGLFTAKGSHNVGFEITTASLVGRKGEPGSARQLKIKLSSFTQKGRDQELANAQTALGICNKARLNPEQITTRDLEILENIAKSLPKDSELFNTIQTIKQEIVSDIQDKTRSNPEQITTRDLEILENIAKSLPKDSELFEDIQETKAEATAAITCKNVRENLMQVAVEDLEHMYSVRGSFNLPPDSKLFKTIDEVQKEVTAKFSGNIKQVLEGQQEQLLQQDSLTNKTLDQLLNLLTSSYKSMHIVKNKRIPFWSQRECEETKAAAMKNATRSFIEAKAHGGLSLKVLVLAESIKDTRYLSSKEKNDVAQSLQGTFQGFVENEIREGLQECIHNPFSFSDDTRRRLKIEIKELVNSNFLPEGTSFESIWENIMNEPVQDVDSDLDEVDLNDYGDLGPQDPEDLFTYDDLGEIAVHREEGEYNIGEPNHDEYLLEDPSNHVHDDIDANNSSLQTQEEIHGRDTEGKFNENPPAPSQEHEDLQA